ncbi:MAG: hypothetical protein BWY04_01167 [candidate division CPR1 bacterium ADurb.Bin160]|uniref:Uncharacterized protein n=1 Tax=candidate division CPR1 bacterium ADurb.Bin160 TaxID=1852826 RepID=A0A1V5ZLA4_9BACT|nr:MAG: hypothetical protein BWY04_01167 [candidate division CPR1 bacterium ADurb.Bin160]
MKYFLEQVYLETGLRDITKLASSYKEAEIYFHMDLDGVTSAIAIKEYLKRYGIKTIAAHVIQYGEKEYAITKVSDTTLKVLVDFAHGKTMMNIHTDHHDKQVGVEKGVSTSFVKSPSNAAYISTALSPSDIFPPHDAELISVVDSADFAKRGITIDDVLQTVFSVDKEKELMKNKQNLGFVVNKMLLFYKNKKNFLSNVVMQSSPSLISMYNTIKNVVKQLELSDPSEIKKRSDEYIGTQNLNSEKGSDTCVGRIMMLKTGNYIVYDNYAVQYDGGLLIMKGGYDRYTIFKNQPQIDIFTMGWSMGLIQISKNPFKKDKSPEVEAINLGEYVQTKLLPKFKKQLESEYVSLLTIKEIFEKEVTKNRRDSAVGFTMKDFISLFQNSKVKGINLNNKSSFNSMIEDIANKKYYSLSDKQKEMLKKIQISLWDIVQAQSGGHKDITNISGLNFARGMKAGEHNTNLIKPMMIQITRDMLKFLGTDKKFNLTMGNFDHLLKPEVRESLGETGETSNDEVKPLEGKFMSIDDKDGRFKFGTIAEEIVYQHLTKNAPEGTKIENTKNKEGWSSLLDLKFGDIWITKSTGKVIKADVKSGRAVTLNSIEKFEGDIYIFVNSRSTDMNDSYVVSANNIKKYCKMLIAKDPSKVIKLKSGMDGIRIDFKNEAQNLPKMTFAEYLSKFKGSN